jgi:hypothetical protein
VSRSRRYGHHQRLPQCAAYQPTSSSLRSRSMK